MPDAEIWNYIPRPIAYLLFYLWAFDFLGEKLESVWDRYGRRMVSLFKKKQN